jgi:bacillithiol biosynthesis deacetylase BshB1
VRDGGVTYDVVAFGAHPDDAEMGMGGTIAALSQAGRRVIIVSLTHGEQGSHGTRDHRVRESAAAARILGCDHRLLDFPDTRVAPDFDSRARLMRLVRELRPQLVFAPYHTSRFGHHDGAAHVDHLATGTLARDAVKLARIRGVEPDLPAHDVRRTFYYMVPRDQYPALLVDVSAHMATVVRALEAYETQMRIERQGNAILSILDTYRRYHGITAGCTHAEAFLCEEALRADAETLFRV